MNAANAAPIADGSPLYGACRPGHLGAGLEEWTRLLRDAGISTVVCLLSRGEAARWGLPDAYAEAFQSHHVPVRDRHLPTRAQLRRILDIVESTTGAGDRAAVHCNAGLGRTGVVGAAWLVRARDFAPDRALETVEAGPLPRAPHEAVRADNATTADLLARIDRR